MSPLLRIALPLVLLAAWFAFSVTASVNPLFLPSPLDVVTSLAEGVRSGVLVTDAMATLRRAVLGFLVSLAVGVPSGLLVGRVRSLSVAVQPTVDFFRSIPATALFPLFLVIFGLGDKAKITIVVYACSLIILVNTAYGARQVKAHRLRSARIMGATRWQAFYHIVVPESAPGIFAGARVALSMSLVLVVVTEMFIGTTSGLGWRIIDAQMVYRTPEMYGAILLTGFLGYGANLSIVALEGRALHWVGR